MDSIDYRELHPDELEHFRTIDRSERIDGRYAIVDGKMTLQDFHLDVTGWHKDELVQYVARLHETLARGGSVFGAWDNDGLAGVSSLDIAPIGGNPALVKLDLLHVSAHYRHQGIGTRLTALVIERARSHGATALYISATPTRNTVDAYLRMGARLLHTPDPELYTEEPEDIHLVLPIPGSFATAELDRTSAFT